MILFSHPTGNANVRAALAEFLEAGCLGEFHTSVATFRGNNWDRLSWFSWGREFQRRRFAEQLKPLTVQHPFRELGRTLCTKLRLNCLIRHETGPFCADAIYRTQDRLVARRLQLKAAKFSGVYAYEDGALKSFRMARKSQIRCYYDLPIAYWETRQSLLREEAERLPAWKPTLAGTRDSDAKLARKREELELAEVVLCPSKFVADSLPENARAQKKVVVAQFGSPSSSIEAKTPSTKENLRVLFVGSMTQRKGLCDLLAAMRLLGRKDIELVILGSPQAPMEFYRREFPDFIHELPRSHAEVLKLMRNCDVFCLPSIVEGRALVMQEAMSQGLPLIITPNTGGDDLIEEGVTGFLVPIRRPDLIAEKINWFADNRSAIPEMSRAAQRKAAEYSWEAYGKVIVEAVTNKK